MYNGTYNYVFIVLDTSPDSEAVMIECESNGHFEVTPVSLSVQLSYTLRFSEFFQFHAANDDPLKHIHFYLLTCHLLIGFFTFKFILFTYFCCLESCNWIFHYLSLLYHFNKLLSLIRFQK